MVLATLLIERQNYGLATGGGSSVGRALAFQAGCRGFESRPPLRKGCKNDYDG